MRSSLATCRNRREFLEKPSISWVVLDALFEDEGMSGLLGRPHGAGEAKHWLTGRARAAEANGRRPDAPPLGGVEAAVVPHFHGRPEASSERIWSILFLRCGLRPGPTHRAQQRGPKSNTPLNSFFGSRHKPPKKSTLCRARVVNKRCTLSELCQSSGAFYL